MKKGWKIFWIVCAACAGTGLVCLAVSFVLGVTAEAVRNRFPGGIGIVSERIERIEDDWDNYWDDDWDDDWDDWDDDDVSHHDEDHQVQGVYDSAGGGAAGTAGSRTEVIEGDTAQAFTGVRSLEIDMSAGDVEICPAQDASGQIKMETEGILSEIGLRCYMEQGELVIRTKEKLDTHWLNSEGYVGKVYVYVPQDVTLDEVSLDIGRGKLETVDAGELRAHELSVDVGAGMAYIGRFTAQDADISCGAGSVTARGTINGEGDISCGVGSIDCTLIGKEADYNYEISCSLGDVCCGDSKYSGLMNEQEVYNGAVRNMDVTCGVGNINVTFVDEIY